MEIASGLGAYAGAGRIRCTESDGLPITGRFIERQLVAGYNQCLIYRARSRLPCQRSLIRLDKRLLDDGAASACVR